MQVLGVQIQTLAPAQQALSPAEPPPDRPPSLFFPSLLSLSGAELTGGNGPFQLRAVMEELGWTLVNKQVTQRSASG